MPAVGKNDNHIMVMRLFTVLLLAGIVLMSAWSSVESQELDIYPKWSKVELEFSGPDLKARD